MEHNQIPLLLLCKWECSESATGTLCISKWGASAKVCTRGELFKWRVDGSHMNLWLSYDYAYDFDLRRENGCSFSVFVYFVSRLLVLVTQSYFF